MCDLVMATEGACAGHLCDNCPTCQRGRCCRKDNPDYRLPALGEWDGPIHGELGTLRSDGVRLECHCCGEWFVSLGNHVWWTHDLTADEYRSIFGLSRGHSLKGEQARAKQSEVSKRLAQRPDVWDNLHRGMAIRDAATREQRRAWFDRRFDRMESIKNMQLANSRQGMVVPSPRAILDWDRVREIRSLAEQGTSVADLVQQFGVAPKTIRDVIKGESWKAEPER